MLNSKLTLVTLALLMAVVSMVILRKQFAAKNCPVHNRYAGFAAMLIAVALLLLSLVVAALAVLEIGPVSLSGGWGDETIGCWLLGFK